MSAVHCAHIDLKNYYSPIWIAMRWYKARAFI